MRCERRSPPWRLARFVPLSRHALTKRTALAAEISNRSAAARRDIPPSTAWITRTRKSSDRGFAMRTGLPPSTQGESEFACFGNPYRFNQLGFCSSTPVGTAAEIVSPSNNKVFIVYGHDIECREQLELLLRRMKLEPVILQNLPISGDTIIEKLEANIDVRYAFVLLTPDDEGFPTGQPKEKKLRARQNVILELGMFLVR